MDPAHTPEPLARLGLVEAQLQHHEATLASIAADVRQAAAYQEQGFATLATQVQQLTTALAQTIALPAYPDPPPPAPTQHGPVS